MKVKELKLLLNPIDDELEIEYFSFDEGMFMNIKAVSVEKHWKNNNQDMAVIKEYDINL